MEKINMEVQKLNWSCSKESPEYLQVSLAAAMTLGFSANTFYRNAFPRCINLLLSYDDGCYARCAYCGLSNTSPPLLKGGGGIIRRKKLYPCGMAKIFFKRNY